MTDAARGQAACCQWQTHSGCRSEGVSWGLLLLTLSQALLQVREGEVACVRGPPSGGPSVKEGGREEARAPAQGDHQPRRQNPASCVPGGGGAMGTVMMGVGGVPARTLHPH